MAWILPEDELADPEVRGREEAPARRLYSLFVHYSLKPSELNQEGLPNRIVLTDRGSERLERDVEFLKKILAPKDGWHGFAFLFLDPGWKELLAITDRYGPAVLIQAVMELQQTVDHLVLGRVPIRFVTAARLVKLLGILEQNAGGSEDRFSHFLVGREDRFQYDSVKVIEAVIRIANFGRNIPILRFDNDVLFHEGSDRGRDLESVRKNILCLCRRYTELADHPDAHYFVFSGSYLPAKRIEAVQGGSNFECDEALNGFATRVGQLALLPETADLRQPARLDLNAVREFLGTLWNVGANPFRQVISGAGLCLSDSAILDLPPYSNMREFVMWIDDHLKFALHHELRHFGQPGPDPTAATEHGPLPRIGRVAEASFPQGRHPVAEGGFKLADVRWHTSEYLPRLLRGCIADKWLRENPRLKRPAGDFERARWLGFLRRGEYATYFARTLTSRTEEQARAKIRGKLWRKARERLQEIVTLWAKPAFRGTFLHLIVVGPTGPDGGDSRFSHWQHLGFVPKICPGGLRQAVEELGEDPPRPAAARSGRRGRSKAARADRQALTLERLVADLIDDFIDYVDLVRFWKTFVQSTRFLLNTERDRQEVFWAFPAEYPPGV